AHHQHLSGGIFLNDGRGQAIHFVKVYFHVALLQIASTIFIFCRFAPTRFYIFLELEILLPCIQPLGMSGLAACGFKRLSLRSKPLTRSSLSWNFFCLASSRSACPGLAACGFSRQKQKARQLSAGLKSYDCSVLSSYRPPPTLLRA